MTTKSIILHLLAWAPSPQISPEVMARTIEPMRAELRRREALGIEAALTGDSPCNPATDPFCEDDR